MFSLLRRENGRERGEEGRETEEGRERESEREREREEKRKRKTGHTTEKIGLAWCFN